MRVDRNFEGDNLPLRLTIAKELLVACLPNIQNEDDADLDIEHDYVPNICEHFLKFADKLIEIHNETCGE